MKLNYSTKKLLKEIIFDILFECYPKDMENFSTMTENQAYRLVKKFWNKVDKLYY